MQVEEAGANARKVCLLHEIRRQLLLKDYSAKQAAGGTSVSFRFRRGRVDHTFPLTCSVKVY